LKLTNEAEVIMHLAVGETAWQLPRVWTVISAAWMLAVPIKFQNVVTW